MTPLQWTLLSGAFTLYILFGGTIFMVLEHHNEVDQREQLHLLKQDVQEILIRMDHDFYHNETSPEDLDELRKAKESVLTRISEHCGGFNLLEEFNSEFKWNYYNSVFFAFTVVTTIGYGHLSPETKWSRIFTIFYALIGIPLDGILITQLSSYFSSKLVKVHKRSKEKKYESKLTIIFEILFYLIPGIIVFIIIPAGFFVYIESWNFLDSVYFSFVSLTTIGFGDYVAGMGSGQSYWLWLYKIILIIWIIFGLGYLVMILGFITKGLTHKKVRRVIKKKFKGFTVRRDNISKEVDYLRRVVNELYLLKLKPIYNGEEDHNENENNNGGLERVIKDSEWPLRSQFRSARYKSMPSKARKRNLNSPFLARRRSEADLTNLSQVMIFGEESVFIDPKEMVSDVVAALNQDVINHMKEALAHINEYGEMSGEVYQRDLHSKDDFENSESQEEMSDNSGDSSNEDDGNDLEDEISSLSNEQSNDIHHVQDKGTSLMEKVTGAIRKISAGAKDVVIKKVSKSEVEKQDKERKISRNSHSFRGSPLVARHLTNKDDEICKIDKSEHLWNSVSYEPSALEINESELKLRESNGGKAKVKEKKLSKNESPCTSRRYDEGNKPEYQKISIDNTTIVDFLKALDDVQQKLKDGEDACTFENDRSDTESRKGQKGDNDYNMGSRRRKLGVCNNNFSYDNHAYTKDSTNNDI